MESTLQSQGNFPVQEELSDMLLVFDKEEKQLKAVKGIDKDGQLQTTSSDNANQEDFMRVDANGNILSNFFSNFLRQTKNPTRFTFFKIPIEKSLDTIEKLQNHLTDLSEKGKAYLKKYEVSPTQYTQGLSEKNQQQKHMTMETTNTPVQEPQKEVKQENVQPAQTPSNENSEQQNEPKYKIEDVDWETLNNLGISKESLEKRNLLEPLLRGFKTNELVPVSFNLGSAVTRFDARLSLQQNSEGKVVAAIHGIRKEPQLQYPFFGHEFSDEDKKNLLTTGNMGRVVELTNTKTGEKIPSVISVDKLTNELIALRTEFIKIPDEIKGVKLSEEQKQTLKEGKPLFLEGMQSKKGEPFNANVQFNADKRYVEFLFEDNLAQKTVQFQKLTEAPKEIRGVQLTQEQHQQLSEGKPVYLEGLQSKNGKAYNGYFTFNQEKGKVEMSFKNPDKKDISNDLQAPKKEQKQTSEKTKKAQKQETAPTPKNTKSKGRKM
ncbi:DUF3945 domain-containing protein [Capnocytophaga canis]|uniref:DUF3945 domain-containing protein n=1 Tax=Capnocytophaga canis TaxID=1848903 RepID=UPI00370DDC6D